MAVSDNTYPYAARFSSGSIRLKNAYNGTLGYTSNRKKVAAGTNTAVLAATNGATSPVTVTSGITDPDVPRALVVKPGGTSTDVIDSNVTINGFNVEGKPISEVFKTASNTTTAINGVLAFKRVTSVVIGQQGGAGATFSVGTTNKLGLNHRLYNQNTTVKVYSATAIGEPGGMPSTLSLQGAPTVVSSEDQVERNLVTPATTPDGSTFYEIFYYYDNWALAPVNDQPEYSTTTSTSSTSSSTSSTTITTSTSSTSISTSSTSSSSTSSSLSTSSTSTSTTTAP